MKRKIIIDTDCGVDDAQAVLLALSKQYEESIEVLGITCVCGNTSLDNVCRNVLKVLTVASRTEIPVYRGAEKAIIAHNLDASHFHGKDGLGDVVPVSRIPEPDMSLLQEEHAVNFLVRCAKEQPGEITVLALGPLTNVALAAKMDRSFASNLKELYIMGGSFESRGNVSLCAEFNFHFDPEAAYITLDEFSCPLVLVTLEACDRNPFGIEFMDQYFSQGTKKAEFVNAISEFGQKYLTKYEDAMYGAYDPSTIAIFLDPDIVLKCETVFATVELHGEHTRGQLVVDWKERLGKKKNVSLPINFDVLKLKSLMVKSLQ